MNLHIPSSKLKPPPNWDRSGLPSWTYFNDELFELEAEELSGNTGKSPVTRAIFLKRVAT